MKFRRWRRLIVLVFTIAASAWVMLASKDAYRAVPLPVTNASSNIQAETALGQLPVKGRAPTTGYSRSQFGDGWSTVGLCNMRNIILKRDMPGAVVNVNCDVVSGTLNDPYTGKIIEFRRGETTSADVQIDHVVALSDTWQTGAQQLTLAQRTSLANDPLELLAVDGQANQDKSGSDAASWLPPNKSFRCQYVARQIAVKRKYSLWVTDGEKQAMQRVLTSCPGQALP